MTDSRFYHSDIYHDLDSDTWTTTTAPEAAGASSSAQPFTHENFACQPSDTDHGTGYEVGWEHFSHISPAPSESPANVINTGLGGQPAQLPTLSLEDVDPLAMVPDPLAMVPDPLAMVPDPPAVTPTNVKVLTMRISNSTGTDANADPPICLNCGRGKADFHLKCECA